MLDLYRGQSQELLVGCHAVGFYCHLHGGTSMHARYSYRYSGRDFAPKRNFVQEFHCGAEICHKSLSLVTIRVGGTDSEIK